MKESKLILMQNSVAIALQEHLGKERWEELIKKLEEKETKNQVEQIKKDEKK